MFLWTKPLGMKIFGNTKGESKKTKVLAGSQGLYNGFISAGLAWGLFHPRPELSNQIVLFFLLCVVIAGFYSSITAKRSILYIQALPAFIATIFVIVNMVKM
jgi:putative membrane protein